MIFNPYHVVSFSIILFFSLILSIQDIKTLSANIFLQCFSIFCALASHLVFNRNGIWIYILSSIFSGAFYFVIRKITRNKLGPADVWFGFFQGIFLIPQMIAVCFVAESLTALCIVLIHRKTSFKPFPFIPFMSFGLIISYILQIIFFPA